MEFYLIGHERRVDNFYGIAQHRNSVVGHPNVARQSFVMCLLKQFERGRNVTICRWPMKQKHIDVVGAQVFEALFDRGQERVVREALDIDLCRDAKVFACKSCRGQAFASCCLIFIHLCRVKRTIPNLRGTLDRREQSVTRQWVCPEGALVVLLEIDGHECFPFHSSSKGNLMVTYWKEGLCCYQNSPLFFCADSLNESLHGI